MNLFGSSPLLFHVCLQRSAVDVKSLQTAVQPDDMLSQYIIKINDNACNCWSSFISQRRQEQDVKLLDHFTFW